MNEEATLSCVHETGSLLDEVFDELNVRDALSTTSSLHQNFINNDETIEMLEYFLHVHIL